MALGPLGWGEEAQAERPTGQGDLNSSKEVLCAYPRTSNLGQISRALSGCGSAGCFSCGEGLLSTFSFSTLWEGREESISNTDLLQKIPTVLLSNM